MAKMFFSFICCCCEYLLAITLYLLDVYSSYAYSAKPYMSYLNMYVCVYGYRKKEKKKKNIQK